MKVKIRENIYGMNIDDLISIGNRINNSKRNFLFISKVLGKHIEVKPDVCKAIGFLLASTIYGRNDGTNILINYLKSPNSFEKQVKEAMKLTYRTKENVAILGFAETATGLGMAVAAAIENSYYITTTREEFKDKKSLLNFEEEHSHATTHKCFPEKSYKLKEADRIILVDDEITTGKSMINIIRELKRTTNVRKYTILSVLDLRNLEYRNLLENFIKENNIEIEVKALISADIKIENKEIFYDSEENLLDEKVSINNLKVLTRTGEHLKFTGKFGMDFNEIQKSEEECIKAACRVEELLEKNEKILVLGHGENIYIPSRIASYIKGDVYFKSTTRSPIYCNDKKGYPIKEKNIFYHNGIKYYLYNKSDMEENYDKVVLITEDNLDVKLTKNLIIVKP
ncbi:phosphoribosyltransferase domain-containing protein [Clostridium senegalense]|uniref:phosphoribosyltransferase domain-containing protein n=1 Tax=Clostridium senegalense TaxID=1465809 RepID=UPI000289D7B8|nr:phosphoribosyltransferase domain-containing protein [Clostridium senegalense]